MSLRLKIVSIALALSVCIALFCGAANADFLISGYTSGAPEYFRDNATFVRSFGPPPHEAESLDAFALSADGDSVYVFGNNLGYISNFAFDLASGASQGVVGPNYPPFGSTWPNGLVANFGVSRPQTRAGSPPGGGDLFYIGFIDSTSSLSNLLNIVDTAVGDFVGQVQMPAATQILNFAFGAGALGPQSRLLVATQAGVFAFQEVAALGGTSFELESATPLIAAPLGQMGVGPDGRIYAMYGAGISRFSPVDGSLIDTFLTPAQYNPLNLERVVMRFGPDGTLYFGSSSFIPLSSTMIKFNVATGASQPFPGFSGFLFGDFAVLPIPEPSSLLLAAIGAALTLKRRRRNLSRH